MEDMAPYLFTIIKRAEDKDGTGQATYIRLFVNTTIYSAWRADVDLILSSTTKPDSEETYANCIVA